MSTQTAPANKQPTYEHRPVRGRRLLDKLFVIFCICVASTSVIILVVLLAAILVQGIPYMSVRFLTGINESEAENAGIYPALLGTLWVCFVCAAFALPIGVGTAIFLEEFKPKYLVMRLFHNVVQLNINNLAGVPSVVYGIIGLTAFVAMFGLSRRAPSPTSEAAIAASTRGEGEEPPETEEVPLFEFGATYYDQFGLADSDRRRSIEFEVDGRMSPRTKIDSGITGLSGQRPGQVKMIGAWDVLVESAAEDVVTVRQGSPRQQRVQLGGRQQGLYMSVNWGAKSKWLGAAADESSTDYAHAHYFASTLLYPVETLTQAFTSVEMIADEPASAQGSWGQQASFFGDGSIAELAESDSGGFPVAGLGTPHSGMFFQATGGRTRMRISAGEFTKRFADEFQTFDGSRVYVEVENDASPPTAVRPPLAIFKKDGSKETARILSSSQVPTVEFKIASIELAPDASSQRVAVAGRTYDEFVSSNKMVVRIPVTGDSLELKDGSTLTGVTDSHTPVEVLVVAEDPYDKLTDSVAVERLEIDGEAYDQLLTADDFVLRIPVASASAPPTVFRPGKKYRAQNQRGLAVNVLFSDTPRPGGANGRFDEALRAPPEPGRVRRDAWYCFRLPFGRSVLAGGLTLMLVILPIIIISSQESLRAVPDSLRKGAMGMGATRWQVVRNVTLPAAVPGIMTGSILAMSRAIGEAAPVLIICGIVFISYTPGNLMSEFTVMPLQIYNWAALPDAEFQKVAASGIIVLLAVLLCFNGLAVFIRQKMQKPL